MDQFGINLKEKLEYIIIVIVLVTTLPVIIKFMFGKKKIFLNTKTKILNKIQVKIYEAASSEAAFLLGITARIILFYVFILFIFYNTYRYLFPVI